jgi:hypothetical protein
MPLLAFAAVPPSRSATQENPRFASLRIEIWPEFDRQAALVILKGELPAELALPAAVSLRIPASSGGPSAVAFATTPGAELFNLAHDRSYGKDFITLRFEAPQRFVHIEFYDPLVTRTRPQTPVWASDLADRLSVRLQGLRQRQHPVQPDLGQSSAPTRCSTGRQSRRLRGKPLPIEIPYEDDEEHRNILGLKIPGSAPAVTSGTREALPDWLLVLAIIAWSARRYSRLAWWRRQASGLNWRQGFARNAAIGSPGARFARRRGRRNK